jgi:hypothetical protein
VIIAPRLCFHALTAQRSLQRKVDRREIDGFLKHLDEQVIAQIRPINVTRKREQQRTVRAHRTFERRGECVAAHAGQTEIERCH